MDERLISDRFPRASGYHPEWLLAGVSGAANPLWMTEWLAEALDLRSGMRVLDLGCGRAAASVFLRREFGVQVWATDLWFSASENLQRIRDAGVEDGVFPHVSVTSTRPRPNYTAPNVTDTQRVETGGQRCLASRKSGCGRAHSAGHCESSQTCPAGVTVRVLRALLSTL